MGIWDIAYVLFKHKWRIVLTTTFIIVTLVAFSFVWPPKFEASSRFMLSKTTSVNLDPTIFPQITTSLMRPVTGNEEANNEREILLSRPVIEAVVRKLDLATPYDPGPPQGMLASIQHQVRKAIVWAKGIPRWILETLDIIQPKSYEKRYQDAIEDLTKDLIVGQIPDSDVLKISYEGWYPEHLTAVVDEVSRQYLRHHLEVHQSGTATEFYTDYLAEAQGHLEDLEQQLADFRSEHAIIDINKVEAAYLEKVEILERQRITLRKEMIAMRSKLGQMRKVMDDPSNPIIPNLEVNNWESVIVLNDQRIEEELRLTGLEDRYKVDHPLVERQRGVVQHVKGALRGEVERLRFIMERQLQDWEAEYAAIGVALEQLRRSDGASLPHFRQELDRLERSIEDANAVYEEIAKRRADAQLRTARDDRMVKVKLLEAPSVPTSPVWPDLFLNLLVGVPLAPILAISLAFFVEGLRRTFRRAEDIEERLEIDALAVLPAARNERALREHGRVAVERLAAFVLEQPTEPPPTLLVAESESGEGASDVATLLAEALAASGRKVLLADYRGSSERAHRWGVGPTAQALRSVGRVTIHETTVNGLCLARVDAEDQGMRSHAELERELASLRDGFAVTLIDAPPVEEAALAPVLSAAATGSILTVRADRTGQLIAARALDQLRGAGTEVLGGVLTGYRRHIPAVIERRL